MKYTIFALIGAASAISIKQEEKKVEEKLENFHGYTTDYNGFEGNNHLDGQWRDAYNRIVPEAFSGDQRDTFTSKMISEYALEGQDKETGKPNG